jgi:hypothetical protein
MHGDPSLQAERDRHHGLKGECSFVVNNPICMI